MTARELPSIRSRLTRLLVGVALVWGLGVSVAVWLAVRHEVDELLDETLRASAAVLAQGLGAGPAAGAVAAPGADVPAVIVASPEPPADEAQFAWQLIGADGRVLQRSLRAPAEPWLPLATVGFADAGKGWRLFGQRLDDGQRLLYVAQTRAERREAQAEVALSAIWAAVLIAALSAWWLRRRVRGELSPLLRLSRDLETYEPLPPMQPLPAAARRELQPVHAAIEALGGRLARRVANERAFAGHAAHALRTPLAGIDLQLAVAEREAPAALVPRLARVREATSRLTRVVAALLALFRSGAELRPQALEWRALIAGLGIDGLQLDAQGPALLQADVDLLCAALINLLDNASRNGAQRVQCVLQHGQGMQRLALADDGHGAPAEQVLRLQAALDAQDYEGRTGLGLMMADLVARAHGGRLRLLPAERGFAVELSWPAMTTQPTNGQAEEPPPVRPGEAARPARSPA